MKIEVVPPPQIEPTYNVSGLSRDELKTLRFCVERSIRAHDYKLNVLRHDTPPEHREVVAAARPLLVALNQALAA